MKINSKTIQRTVKIMTNPNPDYVSIVDHAASQQPFAVLKSAGANQMPIQRRESNVQKSSAPPKKTAKIRKVVFDKATYKTEESVKKYLDDSSYTDYTIKGDDNVFTAEGAGVTDADFVKNSVKKINMDTGVTGYVGAWTEESVQKHADTQVVSKSVAPAGEKVLKFSWWATQSSKATSIKQVLEEGMTDGIPPGMSEIVSCGVMAMANAIVENDNRATKINGIAGEMASMVNSVAELFTVATEGVEKVQKQGLGESVLDTNEGMGGNRHGTPTSYPRPEDKVPDGGAAAGEGMGGNRTGTPTSYPRPEVAITINVKRSENVEKFVSSFKQELETITKGTTSGDKPMAETTKETAPPVVTEAKKEEPVQTSAPVVTEPVKKDEPVVAAVPAGIDMNALGAIIGTAVKGAVEVLTTQVTALSTKVDAASAAAKEAQESATKAAKTTEEFASRHPTMKGVSDQGPNDDEAVKKAEAQKAEKQAASKKNLNSAFGVMTR